MHGSVNENKVTPISYKQLGENGLATPPISTSTPKKDGKKTNPPSPEEVGNAISSALNAASYQGMSYEGVDLTYASDDDEALPPIPPKSQDLLDRNSLGTNVPASSLEETKDGEPEESPYTELDLPLSEKSVYGESESTFYATMNSNNKTPKESVDNGVKGHSSEEKKFDKKASQYSNSRTPSTTLPSYSTGNSKESLLSESKKTNRIWPRAKYAMQQKSVIIFGASAITLGISAALVYLQDKAKFIAFVTNSPKYITIPVIALAALLAIGPIFFAIKQFRNTAEHKTQGKNADEVLDDVLEHQPEGKAIKSVRLEYSNGTHSNFVLNAWEAKQGFTNIDEKVVSRTNKIKSVINDRPLFTALLTGVVAANIAFPLGLLATHGVNGVQEFYQNPLINNIGLSLLIGSSTFALLIICLGVHYYRKTNCTNLIYLQEEIRTESVNKELIEEIKRERTSVLEENHGKDAKRSSLTLEQIVVQSHNCKDVVYSVG